MEIYLKIEVHGIKVSYRILYMLVCTLFLAHFPYFLFLNKWLTLKVLPSTENITHSPDGHGVFLVSGLHMNHMECEISCKTHPFLYSCV